MKKGEQTRKKIIDAAAALIERRGMAATGINEVIAKSGAPRGSLYHHFPGGKDELTCIALRAGAERWREQLQKTMRGHANAADAVFAACEALAQRLTRSGFERGCPLATTTLEVAASNNDVQAVCSEHFVAWEDFLTELISNDGGKEEDARAFAILTLASIEGALLLCRAHRQTSAMDTVAALLRTQLHHRRQRLGADHEAPL